MLAFTNEQILSLPVDELALAIVADFVSVGGWNEYNYYLESKEAAGLATDQMSAIAEAFAWARAHGLIARTPGQSDPNVVFVTRRGHRAAQEGLGGLRAEARLGEGLHAEIERRARRQFLLGELEGEREGMRSLFAGAYAVLRNPSGHRDVDYDDPDEAAEAVVASSLLLRMLDPTRRPRSHPPW